MFAHGEEVVSLLLRAALPTFYLSLCERNLVMLLQLSHWQDIRTMLLTSTSPTGFLCLLVPTREVLCSMDIVFPLKECSTNVAYC